MKNGEVFRLNKFISRYQLSTFTDRSDRDADWCKTSTVCVDQQVTLLVHLM